MKAARHPSLQAPPLPGSSWEDKLEKQNIKNISKHSLSTSCVWVRLPLEYHCLLSTLPSLCNSLVCKPFHESYPLENITHYRQTESQLTADHSRSTFYRRRLVYEMAVSSQCCVIINYHNLVMGHLNLSLGERKAAQALRAK